VIVIQYRNHGKDLFATTHDYLSLGYSVYWATANNFNNGALDFDTVATNFSEKKTTHSLRTTTTRMSSLLNLQPACGGKTRSPVVTMTGKKPTSTASLLKYDSCPRCGTNRLYDEKRARYLYDDSEMIGPAIGTDRSAGHTEGSSGCGNGRGHVWGTNWIGVSGDISLCLL